MSLTRQMMAMGILGLAGVGLAGCERPAAEGYDPRLDGLVEVSGTDIRPGILGAGAARASAGSTTPVPPAGGGGASATPEPVVLTVPTEAGTPPAPPIIE